MESLKIPNEMKNTLQLLALAVLSLVYSSCCGLLPCGASLTEEREVTKLQEVSVEVVGKNRSYTTIDHVPVTVTETVTDNCNECGSSFCPRPQCCGIINKSVLARATGQGGTGEPQIGLIATMKTLAP